MINKRAFFMGLGAGVGAGVGLGILFSQPVRAGINRVVSASHEVGSELKDAAGKKIHQFAEAVDAAKEGYAGQQAWREETEGIQRSKTAS